MRLTVVTIFGLIGTDHDGLPGHEPDRRGRRAAGDATLAFVSSCSALTVALTIYTMVKSKRLSDFLDAVSDERLSLWTKVKAFFAVWRSPG